MLGLKIFCVRSILGVKEPYGYGKTGMYCSLESALETLVFDILICWKWPCQEMDNEAGSVYINNIVTYYT